MSSIRLQRSRAVSTRVQHLCSAASALPLAIALCVSPAAAQTSDAVHHGDAITVTGVRQAYRGDFALREIPQSIAEIDAETLQQNNILRLTDALDMNASVARQ
ncbi:MAG: TonB-dependent siderophore receptor, partial [Pseudomonadota bacterium]